MKSEPSHILRNARGKPTGCQAFAKERCAEKTSSPERLIASNVLIAAISLGIATERQLKRHHRAGLTLRTRAGASPPCSNFPVVKTINERLAPRPETATLVQASHPVSSMVLTVPSGAKRRSVSP